MKKNILIANSSVEFLTSLNKIKNNRELHNSISLEARKFILENFDNDKIAQNLNDFYLLHIK